MAKFRLEIVGPGDEVHPILKMYNDSALDEEEIGLIANAQIPMLKLIEAAKLEAKLSLLTGSMKGKEETVYHYVEAYDALKVYITGLPIKKQEWDRRQVEKKLAEDVARNKAE